MSRHPVEQKDRYATGLVVMIFILLGVLGVLVPAFHTRQLAQSAHDAAILAAQEDRARTTATSTAAAEGVSPSDCSGAPQTLDSGQRVFPIAAKYKDLQGLGMLLTARECGVDRLVQVQTALAYPEVGGVLFLKAPATGTFQTTLRTVGFTCAKRAQQCLQWNIDRKKTMLTTMDLVNIAPFINKILSEDCLLCG